MLQINLPVYPFKKVALEEQPMLITEEDKQKVVAGIEKYKAKRVIIQAPEGLKPYIQDLAKWLESLGVEVALFNEPCFGACDIADHPGKMLQCDLVVHFGHSQFYPHSEIPVVYIPYYTNDDFLPLLEKTWEMFTGKKVGLVTNAQHVREIPKVKAFLESKGITAIVNGGDKQPFRCKNPGQTLGCDATAATKIEDQVDCFLYLASGKFHALGVVKKVQKPVYICDFETNEIVDLTDVKRQYEIRRILKQEKFKDSKNVAILVSTKIGQFNRQVFRLKQKIEAMGKNCWILVMDFVSPQKLEGMNLDCLVNTSCPRVADDVVYRQTIIDVSDIEFPPEFLTVIPGDQNPENKLAHVKDVQFVEIR